MHDIVLFGATSFVGGIVAKRAIEEFGAVGSGGPGGNLRWAIAGFLLLFMTLSLMRMRNLILLMEKRRPWVSELILKRGHR